ncbi:hypothetical protein ACFFGH_19805 [Lysobacter korlensis]|uniref:SPW repeat-containing protein n=1 Tax=Lysobacter korlensis TaxID=553636 RepID=A0ABV6RTH3_9GAMM
MPENHDHLAPEAASPDTGRGGEPRRLNWPATVGFGTLALLWPIVALTGLADALGPLASLVLVLTAIGLAWILGVGFGNVPRPVLTLTLAGGIAGSLLVISSQALGEWPEVSGGLMIAGAALEIGRSAALGALAGVLAMLLQRARRA